MRRQFRVHYARIKFSCRYFRRAHQMYTFFSGQGGNCAYDDACICRLTSVSLLCARFRFNKLRLRRWCILKRSFTEKLAANRIIRPLRYAQHEWTVKARRTIERPKKPTKACVSNLRLLRSIRSHFDIYLIFKASNRRSTALLSIHLLFI